MIPVTGRLPLKIDTGLCAAVFLIAGYYSVKYDIWRRLEDLAWFLFPFCLWLSYYYGPKWYGYNNMCDCIYPPGPYFYPVAVLGTAAVLFLAMLCKKSRFWQYCGRYSLQIFAGQMFVIFWIVEAIQYFTGRLYYPMSERVSVTDAFWLGAIAFLILVLLVYPWHRWILHKSAKK